MEKTCVCIFFFLELAWVSFSARVLELSRWMEQLEPVMGNATLLDLSLPGSHDTMTYDLSTSISEGYEGMGPVVTKLLHSVTPVVAGKFIREQGQTQGLDVTSQLDAGVRFFDFRIMRTDAPGKLHSQKDWYNLHGCQSESPALEYLTKVHLWLRSHPKEIIVIWASRHGDTKANGTNQYPDTTPEERQRFFSAVTSLFGNMMYDASQGCINETRMSSLWKRGTQVVWYASDYVESTASSPLALDANLLDNKLSGAGYGYGSLHMFRSAKAHRQKTKAVNKFFLMSLAASDSCTIEARALLTFLPLIKKKRNKRKCAACYNIPGMTEWCPMSLQETGQINNYYNQVLLEGVFQQGQHDDATDFPNTIYIDGLDSDGQIRTGTERVSPAAASTDANPKTAGYGFSSTVIAANIRRLCRQTSSPECGTLAAAAEAARQKHPVQTWDDAAHGRLASPPPLPLVISSSMYV